MSNFFDQAIPQRMTYVNSYGIRYLDYDYISHQSDDYKFLILLHGLGASAERWLPIAPTLSKYFRVIVPDIIGFGYSDKPTVEYTMDFFIEFFEEFIDNVHIHRPIIIGSSFGGYLATEYAIRFNSRVEKLVLAAPAGMMRSSTNVLDQYIMAALYPTYENALRAFMDMAYDPSIVTEDTVRDFINRMRLPNAKYAFMSTLLGIRDSPRLLGRLSKILAPTLLIWGDNDNMIPLQYSKEYNEIPGSNLVILKDCGHTPFIERPITFSQTILKFLDEQQNT
ncbi:MAG: alpha/beta hydrolase [Nitrososphaeraceae archaeon]